MVATASLMCNIHNMFAKFQMAPKDIASESHTILLVTWWADESVFNVKKLNVM